MIVRYLPGYGGHELMELRYTVPIEMIVTLPEDPDNRDYDRAHQAVQGVLSTLASDDPAVRIAYLLDLPEPEDVAGA
ncbi:hypothetical protein [Promicromonospora soli]